MQLVELLGTLELVELVVHVLGLEGFGCWNTFFLICHFYLMFFLIYVFIYYSSITILFYSFSLLLPLSSMLFPIHSLLFLFILVMFSYSLFLLSCFLFHSLNPCIWLFFIIIHFIFYLSLIYILVSHLKSSQMR